MLPHRQDRFTVPSAISLTLVTAASVGEGVAPPVVEAANSDEHRKASDARFIIFCWESVQDGISRINDPVLDYCVDIGSVGDVVQRVRIENNEIRKVTVFDLADVRASLASKEFCGIAGGALEDLHWPKPSFFHQLKFAEERRPVNCSNVSRIGAGSDRDPGFFQSFQVRQRDSVSFLDAVQCLIR